MTVTSGGRVLELSPGASVQEAPEEEESYQLDLEEATSGGFLLPPFAEKEKEQIKDLEVIHAQWLKRFPDVLVAFVLRRYVFGKHPTPHDSYARAELFSTQKASPGRGQAGRRNDGGGGGGGKRRHLPGEEFADMLYTKRNFEAVVRLVDEFRPFQIDFNELGRARAEAKSKSDGDGGEGQHARAEGEEIPFRKFSLPTKRSGGGGGGHEERDGTNGRKRRRRRRASITRVVFW